MTAGITRRERTGPVAQQPQPGHMDVAVGSTGVVHWLASNQTGVALAVDRWRLAGNL